MTNTGNLGTPPWVDPEWVTTLAIALAPHEPMIYREDTEVPESAYLSIPIDMGALEIESAYSIEYGEILVATVRSWDRTHGLASETEVGTYTPESAARALHLILLGMQAEARIEVAREDDDARRMAEDDAAWATGGYVA